MKRVVGLLFAWMVLCSIATGNALSAETDYHVVCRFMKSATGGFDQEKQRFEQIVIDYMKQGWRLAGGAFELQGHICQALSK